jgi:glycosyltransferase involved in cell wall biosynthesis
MSIDVTAVVPTIGEATLDDSLASLRKQSHKLEEIVVVRDVHPFPEAMNRGVAQVTTPFVLQCDADMILHPDCLETLASAMDEKTGVSIAYLQDDLLGEIQAVKLYRTECLRIAPFENRIATDSDGIERIVQQNYRIVFARRRNPNGQHSSDVLGYHRPNYADPLYVYSKFSVMGSIVRNRNSYSEYKGVLGALKQSSHEMADLAITAFCHGLFKDRKESEHKPFEATEDYNFFDQFSARKKNSHNLFAITRLPGYDRAADLEDLHSIAKN